MCGERVNGKRRAQFICGSSPRVRGTLERIAARVDLRRFIPACAGNAPATRLCGLSLTVHPRVCGERSRNRRPITHGAGSSPRVRGTLEVLTRPGIQRRFIPACAGNAPLGDSSVSTYHGSSPRVRGTRTHAPPPTSPTAVHPRVCGERIHPPAPCCGTGGSSPRVRGTHRRPIIRCTQPRFIPACAGNARTALCGHADRSVHPRVCGERLRPTVVARRFLGSSPRVRGTRRVSTRCG